MYCAHEFDDLRRRDAGITKLEERRTGLDGVGFQSTVSVINELQISKSLPSSYSLADVDSLVT